MSLRALVFSKKGLGKIDDSKDKLSTCCMNVDNLILSELSWAKTLVIGPCNVDLLSLWPRNVDLLSLWSHNVNLLSQWPRNMDLLFLWPHNVDPLYLWPRNVD
jgi:hypothetical protein